MTEVLKVVCMDNAQLVSVIMGWFREELPWRVVYTPGEWTETKNGSLILAFSADSLEHARRFMARNDGHSLWKCEAEDVQPCEYLASPYLSHVSRFWERGVEDENRIVPPRGTVTCKRIKLVTKLEGAEVGL
jgi:hypothetical protein